MSKKFIFLIANLLLNFDAFSMEEFMNQETASVAQKKEFEIIHKVNMREIRELDEYFERQNQDPNFILVYELKNILEKEYNNSDSPLRIYNIIKSYYCSTDNKSKVLDLYNKNYGTISSNNYEYILWVITEHVKSENFNSNLVTAAISALPMFEYVLNETRNNLYFEDFPKISNFYNLIIELKLKEKKENYEPLGKDEELLKILINKITDKNIDFAQKVHKQIEEILKTKITNITKKPKFFWKTLSPDVENKVNNLHNKKKALLDLIQNKIILMRLNANP